MEIQGLDQIAENLTVGIRQLRKYGFKVAADFDPGLTEDQKDTKARFAACALLGLGLHSYTDYYVGIVARALLQNSGTGISATFDPLSIADSPLAIVSYLAVAAGVDLSPAQSDAAAAIYVTLPSNATIRDFLNACNQETMRQLGVPVERIEAIRPLLTALEELAQSGRYGDLFDGKNIADCNLSQ